MPGFKGIIVAIVFFLKVSLGWASDPITFGNAIYVNLSKGEQIEYKGKTVTLIDVNQHKSLIRVEDEKAWVSVAKRSLPQNIGGLRIFVSDQINVKNLTTDPNVHNLLNKDILLCISDPAKPLLDSAKFVFPISREDGYAWNMEEDSHMYAYLGTNVWRPGYVRSHEGVDLNMHDARGKELHPLIAIESGTVVVVADSSTTKTRDGCIILKSDTYENIYYVYKHTNPPTHQVKVGQRVQKGERLSYIWGDNKWGHLHFAIVYRTDVPKYEDRYHNLLNTFPQLYELYFGSLAPFQTIREEGQFTFGYPRWKCKNYKRADAFNAKTGYGWKLGDWCISQKVENAHNDSIGSVRLKNKLHVGTPAECENPSSYYEFEVLVKNGIYSVNATVGDIKLPTSQKIFFENTSVGVFETQGSRNEKTEDIKVEVSDNQLTVRLELIDAEQYAGLMELHFKRINQ